MAFMMSLGLVNLNNRSEKSGRHFASGTQIPGFPTIIRGAASAQLRPAGGHCPASDRTARSAHTAPTTLATLVWRSDRIRINQILRQLHDGACYWHYAAPLRSKVDRGRIRHVSFFARNRSDADDWSGPPFKVCRNAIAPFRGRKGLHNDLLHYTSIENRCENHRLVPRQPSSQGQPRPPDPPQR